MSPLPAFPLGMEKENAHESSYPSCVETGQTTAPSQNKHKKRQQQSKAMASTGRGTLPKGMLEGLDGETVSTPLASVTLSLGITSQKSSSLFLAGGKNYDFVPMSEYKHLHKSFILFGG